MHDVFDENAEALRRLYRAYCKKAAPSLVREDARRLFIEDAEGVLGLRESQFSLAFGMTKQTVVRETTAEFRQYERCDYVEFLELLARFAEMLYAECLGMPLAKKIEFLLDSLLPLIKLARRDVPDRDLVGSSSCSDADY